MKDRNFLFSPHGAASVEYALLIALICLVSLGSIEILSGKVSAAFYDLVVAMDGMSVSQTDAGKADRSMPQG